MSCLVVMVLVAERAAMSAPRSGCGSASAPAPEVLRPGCMRGRSACWLGPQDPADRQQAPLRTGRQVAEAHSCDCVHTCYDIMHMPGGTPAFSNGVGGDLPDGVGDRRFQLVSVAMCPIDRSKVPRAVCWGGAEVCRSSRVILPGSRVRGCFGGKSMFRRCLLARFRPRSSRRFLHCHPCRVEERIRVIDGRCRLRHMCP